MTRNYYQIVRFPWFGLGFPRGKVHVPEEASWFSARDFPRDAGVLKSELATRFTKELHPALTQALQYLIKAAMTHA